MKLHELSPPAGAKKNRKRVGRGNASGHGTYSGRGLKGQKARAGGNINPRFEGGQIPMVLRLPHKRGFHNRFREEHHIVKVEELERFQSGAEVTPEALLGAGLIPNMKLRVKLLGNGDLSKPVTVRVHKWSQGAQQKVEAAGGTLERLSE
jgi:large subunit ribosomal protein L15